MKKTICYIMLACLFSATGFGAYTYEVTTYSDSKTLFQQESMLIDQQGGMNLLGLEGQSSATILGTSQLEEGFGGIWELTAGWNSHLDMSGGQVRFIGIGNDATAFLSGGLIQELRSTQNAWINAGDPPAPTIWNPHITIECLDHSYDTGTRLLTGHWLDSTPFSIQLINVQGYSPTIDNINFIPEPATMLFFAFGGLMIRKRQIAN
ncbi:MAG: PEP-CTERM sorting domain-containing protein [Planctomycetaceae bacterium]|nr:PEP-CTERM sorting domain-containing protein [Planctomycetaceae bacterium]